jgi:hypothetical protein
MQGAHHVAQKFTTTTRAAQAEQRESAGRRPSVPARIGRQIANAAAG